MKIDDMHDAFNLLDDDFIENVAHLRNQKKKKKTWASVLPLVACFGILILATQGKIPFFSKLDSTMEHEEAETTEEHCMENNTQEETAKVPTKDITDILDGIEEITTEESVYESSAKPSHEGSYVIPNKGDSGGRVSTFSYEEDQERWSEHDGVVYEGFQNTEKTKVSTKKVAIQVATLECTIEYDKTDVAYDRTANMWRVVFWTEGIAGGTQIVYLNGNGITQFIVYEE